MAWIGFCCAPMAWANLLDVRLEAGRSNFLLDEPIVVNVVIRNNTDKRALLATDKEWIQFSVSRGRGVPVAKRGRPPEGEVYILKAGETVEREFRLDPFYDFSEPGEYGVRAMVRVPNWDGAEIPSRESKLQVMRGQDLVSIERGVSTALSGATPEVRRYTLQKATVAGRHFMYLRTSDNNSPSFKVFNVLPLGTLIHRARGEFGFQVDAAGVVHVFFQCHVRHFLYCTLNTRGELLRRQMYMTDPFKGAPALGRDVRGRFVVNGGQRVPSGWDFPAPLKRPRGLPAKELGRSDP
jgi:hypothetical protein